MGSGYLDLGNDRRWTAAKKSFLFILLMQKGPRRVEGHAGGAKRTRLRAWGCLRPTPSLLPLFLGAPQTQAKL